MTIVSGNQNKAAEQRAAECGSSPNNTVEFDQVVVLVRLPYLPPQQLSAPRSVERPVTVPSPTVSPEADRTDGARQDQTVGCEEPGSKSALSHWRACVIRLLSAAEERPEKKRISPAAWKAVGLAVTIVLIFAALALLHVGVERDADLAARAASESFPAESPSSGLETLEASPKLILAPKPDPAPTADKQPVKVAQQESIEKRSIGAASTEGSEQELAVVDATVDAQMHPPVESAEEMPADSRVEDQVAELETPELEPMATDDKTSPLVDSPSVSPKEKIPSDKEAVSEEPSPTLAATSTEDAASKPVRAPSTPVVAAKPPGSEIQRADRQTRNAPADMAQPPRNSSDYPITDPSTYQYPSRYEDLLSNAAQGIEDESYPTFDSRTSIYGWHPSTVRLQPRIERPPVR